MGTRVACGLTRVPDTAGLVPGVAARGVAFLMLAPDVGVDTLDTGRTRAWSGVDT